ncbi:MAG: hypothetical protein DPW18_13460 [Chloroflexi bacterium]|nr:hypothetical protein [Chloroflexota bacterium]
MKHLVTLERQQTEQERHVDALQEEQTGDRQRRAGGDRDPQRGSQAAPGIALNQRVARHVSAVERVNRHQVDDAPEDVDPNEGDEKRTEDSPGWRQEHKRNGDETKQKSGNDRSAKRSRDCENQRGEQKARKRTRQRDRDLLVGSQRDPCITRTPRNGFGDGQTACKVQDDLRVLTEAAKSEGMTQFMDEDRNEDGSDPGQDSQKAVGAGAEKQGDQPKQRMNAHRNACNRKAQVETGGGRDLEEKHGLDVFWASITDVGREEDSEWWIVNSRE